jgi:hypothetical protein
MEERVADVHPPVFIGGFRSGSTLLVSYLGLHPRLSAIYETKFLADLLRIARILQDEEGRGERELGLAGEWARDPALLREGAVDFLVKRAIADINLTQQILDGLAPDGKAPHERYALGSNHILWKAPEALDAIGPFVQAVRAGSPPRTLVPLLAAGIVPLFGEHARREGKSRWVNKTPELPRFQPELRQMLGRIKLIHLIRDGRDVVNSSVKLNWWPVETGARSWKIFIEDVRAQAARHPDDYLELRYEDLIADHAGTLERVLAFLGMDGDPHAMIAAQEQYAPGSTRRGGGEPDTGLWRSEMSAADKAVFKAAANDLLVALGYARDADW